MVNASLPNSCARRFGVEARRSCLNYVLNGEDVLHSIPGLHVECKRVERLNVPAAMEQAKVAARGKIPSVWHRRNRSEWLLTIRGADVISLVHLLAVILEHGEGEPKQ